MPSKPHVAIDQSQIPMGTMGAEHCWEEDFFRAESSRLTLVEKTMGPAPSVGVTDD
jgi:hypothetical protein